MGANSCPASREGNTLYTASTAAAAAAKSFQSCPTLCDPIDGSPPGSHIPGILQARVLEWGAIAFSDTASPGKDKNSKFELWFLLNSSCFCTIGKVEKNH